jgi:hypothetical protein
MAELADRPDDVQACRPTTWPSPLAAQRTNPHNRQWPLTLIRFALGEMSTPLTIDETSSGQLRALQAQ